MRIAGSLLTAACAVSLTAVYPCSGMGVSPEAPGSPDAWMARGTLFEACSCSVPCPCNFRQPPTHGSCHSIYLYKLQRAQFDGIDLDGLMFGGAEPDKRNVGFLDDRATERQRPALRKLAEAVFHKGGPDTGSDRNMQTVKMTAKETATSFSIRFANLGGFDADILIGGDGKSPIVVENNTTWPVRRFTKGKTTKFTYRDESSNEMNYDGVNANIGEFDLKP